MDSLPESLPAIGPEFDIFVGRKISLFWLHPGILSRMIGA
jgi:hypothetical protein